MLLYLLRHAEAVDRASSDAARELTARGQEQAGVVGRWCQRHEIQPDVILHSPLRRTVQTAEIVAGALGQSAQMAAFLASGMRPEPALAELRAYQRLASVMVVGHQPDLGDLAATLLGIYQPEALAVSKASLMALRVEQLIPGGASLRFFLPVERMG